jgi:hypothetical protein
LPGQQTQLASGGSDDQPLFSKCSGDVSPNFEQLAEKTDPPTPLLTYVIFDCCCRNCPFSAALQHGNGDAGGKPRHADDNPRPQSRKGALPDRADNRDLVGVADDDARPFLALVC